MIHENEMFKARSINLLKNYLQEGNIITARKTEHYRKLNKLDKNLNQIILPTSKIDMFIDWWNETIRFEKTIPITFKSGYLIIENEFLNKTYNRDDLREIAKLFKSSVFELDEHYRKFIKNKYITIIYFVFTSENKLHVEIYDDNYEMFSTINIEFGNGDKMLNEYEVEIGDTPKNLLELQPTLLSRINCFNLNILITVLWYIATSGKRTKYVYDNIQPRTIHHKKHIVEVSDTKTLTSSIYDLNKIKKVDVNKLNKRKEGWTYSHSFEVHGHYRHYKNGKVIFINPFIKGKNKPLKNQKIILNPKEGE